MGLEGTLKVFSLTDIFQMLGLQRKTGVLEGRGRGRHVTISFLGGSGRRRRVDGAPPGQPARQPPDPRGLRDAGAARSRPRRAARDAAAHGVPPRAGGLHRPAGAARSAPRPDRAHRLHGLPLARRAVPLHPGGHGRLRRGPHGARLDRHDPDGSGADGRRVADAREEARLARRTSSGARPASSGSSSSPARRIRPRERSRSPDRRRRPGAGSTASAQRRRNHGARVPLGLRSPQGHGRSARPPPHRARPRRGGAGARAASASGRRGARRESRAASSGSGRRSRRCSPRSRSSSIPRNPAESSAAAGRGGARARRVREGRSR